jgi:hypothetical protein
MQDAIDRELFFYSTYINIGNDKNMWLHGSAPKDIAPNLYREARFKTRLVHTGMRNLNWIRNLRNINTSSLMEDYIMLHLNLSSIFL